MVLINDGLKLNVRQLVSCLEFTIVLGLLLDSVISQVNQSVAQIVDRVFSARRSQISFFVDPDFGVSVDRLHQNEGSNIEFSFV